MFDPIQYLQLTWLILSHGRLKHSGEDFNKIREESLKGLQDFIPSRAAQSVNSTSPSKNAVTRNLIAQASYIKNPRHISGGHLSFNDLSYIRIPKAASTSMSKEVLEKMYPTLNQKNISEAQINFLTDLNLQSETLNTSVFFTIVRNPFARLVSVYRDLFENKNHYIYSDYLFGILPQQISFPEFVERIARIPDRLKDQHLRPQHAFLKYYEQKNLEVKVFKLEEPEALIQFLNQHGMNLQHMNRSVEPYDYKSYYNEHTMKQVSEIYEVDIIRFGYEDSSPHPK